MKCANEGGAMRKGRVDGRAGKPRNIGDCARTGFAWRHYITACALVARVINSNEMHE